MDKKLKIIALASWYPNDQDPQLGVFIKKQLEAIAQDHEVDLFTLRPAPNRGKEIVNENKINHHKHLYVANQYPIKQLSWYVAWMEIINKIPLNKYDLIHLHVVYPMGIIALKLKSHLSIPLITSEHWSGYHSDSEYTGFLRKRYTKKIIQLSATVVVQSKFLKKLMENRELQTNYQVVPNIVEFSPTESMKTDQSNFVIMNIADHIDSDKNISGLLRSFANALAVEPNLKLIQIGSGPDESKLHALSKSLGISDNVIWKGRFTNKEVLEEIQFCDIGIINSNRETFCISAFELIASKKPIIITECGGPEEYLPDNFGLKISKQNEKQLTEAILSMASKSYSFSTEETATYVRNQFSKKRFIENINLVYNSVM